MPHGYRKKGNGKGNEMNIKKALAGVGEARQGKGGRFIFPGKYRVRVEGYAFGQTRHKKCGNDSPDRFTAELTILEVLSEQEGSNKEGSTVDFYVGLDKEPAASNISNFLMAGCATQAALEDGDVLAINDDDGDTSWFNDEVAEDVYESRALIGVEMIMDAYMIKTRDNKDFTKVTFAVPPELLEEAAAAS